MHVDAVSGLSSDVGSIPTASTIFKYQRQVLLLAARRQADLSQPRDYGGRAELLEDLLLYPGAAVPAGQRAATDAEVEFLDRD